MLHTSFEIWGIAIVVLMIGGWIIKRSVSCQLSKRLGDGKAQKASLLSREHDIQHRALMFLMNQKTDAMLAALAQTIEKERQKLGTVVRKPSVDEPLDALPAESKSVSAHPPSSCDRILPLVRSGMGVSTIARQLQLPEAEISMVVRLKAI